MNRIVVKSTVRGDGVLQLTLPLGMDEANREVQVTVEAITQPDLSREEWSAWVDSLAGAWQGDFERPPQGEYEARETLS